MVTWSNGLPFDENGKLIVTTSGIDPSDPSLGRLAVLMTAGELSGYDAGYNGSNGSILGSLFISYDIDMVNSSNGLVTVVLKGDASSLSEDTTIYIEGRPYKSDRIQYSAPDGVTLCTFPAVGFRFFAGKDYNIDIKEY